MASLSVKRSIAKSEQSSLSKSSLVRYLNASYYLNKCNDAILNVANNFDLRMTILSFESLSSDNFITQFRLLDTTLFQNASTTSFVSVL